MDDSIRKFLGLKKKTSRFEIVEYKLRRLLSWKLIMVVLLFAVLFSSVFLFAKFEFFDGAEISPAGELTGSTAYFNSFYWFVTTITGVGYGDEVPETVPGRILALGIMILGIIFVSLLISQITSMIVAMNVGNLFGIRKIPKKIDCILCGWNQISQAALSELKRPGFEIVVIDKQNIPSFGRPKGIQFITGDPTSAETLKSSNISNTKSIVLAMDDDSEVLLAIHIIRDINPWINIVAKINNPEHIKIAKYAGADQVVSPPSIGGRLLSMVGTEPAAVDWVIRATSGGEGVHLIEYDVMYNSPFANKTVAEARKDFGHTVKILGVDTAVGFQKIPKDELKIEAGNKLIMLVDTKKFKG